MPIQLSDLEDNLAKFLKERFPDAQMRHVIDVGACDAWVSIAFLREFPDVECWMIEPSPMFERMMENLARFPQFRCLERTHRFQLAFGMTEGEGRITTMMPTTVNHLVDDAEAAKIATNPVRIVSGDAFCAEHGIERVNMLKIDAEGSDFKVLLGFREMLTRQAIDFVQVEVGMSVTNKVHIPLRWMSGLLEGFGYHMFRINNQCSWRRPVLEWADVVFISDVMATRLTTA